MDITKIFEHIFEMTNQATPLADVATSFADLTNNVPSTDVSLLATAGDTAGSTSGATDAANSATSSTTTQTTDGLSSLGKYLGAAFSMLGAIGVGASQGYAAGTAAAAVGRNPEAQPKILNTMIVGMAITEAVAIYCFIIAILIIFVG